MTARAPNKQITVATGAQVLMINQSAKAIGGAAPPESDGGSDAHAVVNTCQVCCL